MSAQPDLSIEAIFGVRGKIVLITGGGTGIGLFLAKTFAKNGAQVYIGGRRKEVVDKVASENQSTDAGGYIKGLTLDVTNKESIAAAVKHIGDAHGKLDVLINNAGQSGPAYPFMRDPTSPEMKTPEAFGEALYKEHTFEDWGALFSANVTSIFYVSTAFVGLLSKASQEDEDFAANIINITSISGSSKVAQAHFAYNAAKSAANHLTRLLATELALKGAKIRVNAIAPGLFPSEMTGKEGSSFSGEETTKRSAALVPVPAGRSGRAEEIAGTAVFLASKAGRYTNGQILTVDGGWVAVNPATSS